MNLPYCFTEAVQNFPPFRSGCPPGAPGLLLFMFFSASAVFDAGTGKIPNLLILAAVFPGGLLSGIPFLRRFLVCLSFCFPLFSLRLLGGGDGKLLAVSAAYLGWEVFSRFLFLSLLSASAPALFRLLKEGPLKGRKLPMGPFFLSGYCLLCLLSPVQGGHFL